MLAERSILVVGDPSAECGELVALLELEGFDVSLVETASHALTWLAHQTYADLVLIDMILPDLDGDRLCAELRHRDFTMPIVLLTEGGEDPVVRGLDAGANDCISRPFSFRLLMARLRSQLRSWEKSEDASYRIGLWEFLPSTRLLVSIQTRRRQSLTTKEVNTLRCLIRAAGATVPRHQLMHEIWGYGANVVTHTLETHIYRLRQKIEEKPTEPCFLLTGSGGYRLTSASSVGHERPKVQSVPYGYAA